MGHLRRWRYPKCGVSADDANLDLEMGIGDGQAIVARDDQLAMLSRHWVARFGIHD